ncbi:MAG: YitT family protein [Bulleidia sp.]
MSETIYVPPKPLTWKNWVMIAAGSILYALSVLLFLNPLNLFAGGIVGTAQLIRNVFFAHISGLDVTGIINLAFNIPLFIMAYRFMARRTLYGTVVSLMVQTMILSFVPSPAVPLINDTLAGIMISGILGGIGCGIILSNGGTAGGLDLLGLFLTSRLKNFSVGKLSIFYNACLYSICGILFSVSTAIYSVLWIVFFSFAVDRYHTQNIEVELMIFTHHPEVADMIMKRYVRGVTEWSGEGAYTNRKTSVLVSIVAKKEEAEVRRDILEIDPKAFIITHDPIRVTGGYQKRMDI